MATGTSLSNLFPLGSRLNERGRLEVGGCDAIELAREFGTPAYVVAEDDLRVRARAFVQAGRDAGHDDFHVVFASKAFPCTAVLELFAREGLWCDAASGGELHLALNAGFRPERILLHGNAKSEAELRMALRHRVGAVVIDNFDEIERLARLVADGEVLDRPGRDGTGDGQPVLVRVTPDVRGETHEKISTGQADSKFGFSMAQAQEAIERVKGVPGLKLEGVHAHVGSQVTAKVIAEARVHVEDAASRARAAFEFFVETEASPHPTRRQCVLRRQGPRRAQAHCTADQK